MDTVVESAEEYNIDPAVMVSLIFVESRWKPDAVSRDGACGLTQVLPRYSGGFRGRFGKKLTCKQLQDPVTSIQKGTRIFSWWLRRYGRSRYKIGLCGYNSGFRCKGPTKVKGHRYARKVLRLSRLLKRRMKRIEREEREAEEIPGCYE
tara:strand:+ start:1131 stop:1577 length:447 start_codon:yes stop_codon:yes gene_type:complete